MKIAIDFDGTCVSHEYPEIGSDIGAIPVLQELVENGHELILYTMRSAGGLEDAIKWFMLNKIRLYAIQYDPDQSKWTSSNKCYANLIIDDTCLGIPLINKKGSIPYVDWVKTRVLLIDKGYLSNE